jgi:hypothetical protein
MAEPDSGNFKTYIQQKTTAAVIFLGEEITPNHLQVASEGILCIFCTCLCCAVNVTMLTGFLWLAFLIWLLVPASIQANVRQRRLGGGVAR